MKERFKMIVAVHLFLRQDNKILMSRRFDTGYEDGNYSVPAGHVDGGESSISAMIREAKEEVTIDVKASNLKMVHVMHRNADDWERIDFFFECTKWQGEIKIGEPDKCDDLTWFDLDDLPENMIAYIKSAMDSYKRHEVYSEFGF